jgi:hypothetical protein
MKKGFTYIYSHIFRLKLRQFDNTKKCVFINLLLALLTDLDQPKQGSGQNQEHQDGFLHS